VCDSTDRAWSLIDRLHEQNRAYNLLYTPGRVYCLPRKKQGEFALAEWSNGFSWYELCGGMITYNREAFASLSEARITRELALAACTDFAQPGA
jgi:ATP adenylyltransferase/5',5'''-P-1,P-4-tetraphosphate phosphorylase II